MSNDKGLGMFAKLAQQHTKATQEEADPPANPQEAITPPPPALPEVPKPKRPAVKAKPAPVLDPVKGRRSHPDYCQSNSYLPKQLRRQVEKELLDIEGIDFSILVEDLLRKWLHSRGVSS